MSNFDKDSKMQTFWNEEGGSKWVENIDLVESLLIPMSDRLIDKIGAHPGERVLDVGCGGGLTSIKLAQEVEPGGQVVGVDVSAAILAIAMKRAKGVPNLELKQCDAATASLGDGTFDIITSRFGVMFFDDPVLAFSNLHMALKPGGRLVFLCWRTLEENPWMEEPAKAAFSIVPPPADAEQADPTDPGPFSLGERAHLQKVLTAAGFANIDLQALDLGMPMGSLDETVSFLVKMGPAGERLKDASDADRTRVVEAIRKVMEKYRSADGIVAPTATWLVSATR